MEPTENKKIKHALIDLEMTQAELSEEAKISQAEISKIISGRINPTDAEKKKIAKALNTTVKKIF